MESALSLYPLPHFLSMQTVSLKSNITVLQTLARLLQPSTKEDLNLAHEKWQHFWTCQAKAPSCRFEWWGDQCAAVAARYATLNPQQVSHNFQNNTEESCPRSSKDKQWGWSLTGEGEEKTFRVHNNKPTVSGLIWFDLLSIMIELWGVLDAGSLQVSLCKSWATVRLPVTYCNFHGPGSAIASCCCYLLLTI